MEDRLDRVKAAIGGRYVVEREISRGGMAAVYLARDNKHDRPVAIKVLHPDLAATLGADRFLREIQIEAQLQHPNILPLHDSGQSDGLLYYVMPYVGGLTLRDRLETEKQLSVDDALQIAKEIGDALEYAHEHGIVHRDVKPENILLRDSGAVIVDFGIARAISRAGGDRVTESGHSVGTPAYMSPEQAGGDSVIDGRTDTYSLGCVVYEMLAGEPPFTARSTQALMAKQMLEPAPSLSVIRPSVPASIVTAIDRSLQKSPADRFNTTSEFIAALEAPSVAHRRSLMVRHRRALAAVGVVAVAVLAALVPSLLNRPPTLDSNKVVVFPLVDVRAEGDEGEGVRVALAIGNALEHAQPLKFRDGWKRLPEQVKDDATQLTPELARDVCTGRNAAYYIDGFIGGDGDELTVVLFLHDVKGDSVIARESRTGTDPRALARLSLKALLPLLALLVDPDRDIDLSALVDRQVGAVTSFLQGETEYREGRHGAALAMYKRALEQDSLLVIAGLKGAQAAGWKHLDTEAADLAALAVAHDSLLPPKYAHQARGYNAFLTGDAEGAVTEFRAALSEDPEWSEAEAALGEVYYHLLPSASSHDSVAEQHFLTAVELDTTFIVPLVHLAEIAVRRGDLELTDRYVEQLQAAERDMDGLDELMTAASCVRHGPDAMQSPDSVSKELSPSALLSAMVLMGSASQPACAAAGFRTVLASPGSPDFYDFGALQGLQGLLIAGGRYAEARALIDSAVSFDLPWALQLRMFDAVAGYIADAKLAAELAPSEEEVAAFRRATGTEEDSAVAAPTLWALATWRAHRGDVERSEALARLLEAKARESGSNYRRVLSDALAAHITFARGDTAAAIGRLRALKPRTSKIWITWDMAQPLPLERLLLAKLLLARGDYQASHDVARVFDHHGVIMYLPCLRASLQIRLEAAEGLGDRRLAARYRERLAELDRSAADY